MELTDLQLEIMKLWSDKTLSFGCVILSPEWNIYTVTSIINWYVFVKEGTLPFTMDKIESIWHPITRWRLCYLRQTDRSEDTVVNWVKQKMEKWINLCRDFENNPELYNKDILTRPIQTQNKVKDFILSITTPTWLNQIQH